MKDTCPFCSLFKSTLARSFVFSASLSKICNGFLLPTMSKIHSAWCFPPYSVISHCFPVRTLQIGQTFHVRSDLSSLLILKALALFINLHSLSFSLTPYPSVSSLFGFSVRFLGIHIYILRRLRIICMYMSVLYIFKFLVYILMIILKLYYSISF